MSFASNFKALPTAADEARDRDIKFVSGLLGKVGSSVTAVEQDLEKLTDSALKNACFFTGLNPVAMLVEVKNKCDDVLRAFLAARKAGDLKQAAVLEAIKKDERARGRLTALLGFDPLNPPQDVTQRPVGYLEAYWLRMCALLSPNAPPNQAGAKLADNELAAKVEAAVQEAEQKAQKPLTDFARKKLQKEALKTLGNSPPNELTRNQRAFWVAVHQGNQPALSTAAAALGTDHVTVKTCQRALSTDQSSLLTRGRDAVTLRGAVIQNVVTRLEKAQTDLFGVLNVLATEQGDVNSKTWVQSDAASWAKEHEHLLDLVRPSIPNALEQQKLGWLVGDALVGLTWELTATDEASLAQATGTADNLKTAFRQALTAEKSWILLKDIWRLVVAENLTKLKPVAVPWGLSSWYAPTPSMARTETDLSKLLCVIGNLEERITTLLDPLRVIYPPPTFDTKIYLEKNPPVGWVDYIAAVKAPFEIVYGYLLNPFHPVGAAKAWNLWVLGGYSREYWGLTSAFLRRGVQGLAGPDPRAKVQNYTWSSKKPYDGTQNAPQWLWQVNSWCALVSVGGAKTELLWRGVWWFPLASEKPDKHSRIAVLQTAFAVEASRADADEIIHY
jgi:hypothetical protein